MIAETFRQPITIVGCGGVGSRVAEGLARMNFGQEHSPITLIDGDVFEKKNLSNQLLRTDFIEWPKVEAVALQLLEVRPEIQVTPVPTYADKTTRLRGVVFLCLDHMGSRRVLMEHCLEHNPEVSCVIETRMDSGVGISHCFDPRNHLHQDCWWLYWHPDEEAENMAGCGGHKSVISAVYGTALLALKQFERYLTNRSCFGIPNRVYCDFDDFETRTETWPY